MQFSHNHILHFIITVGVIVIFSVIIFWQQHSNALLNRDANRIISGKLIVQALEHYQKNFGEFPETLSAIEAFISPIPKDPKTGEFFFYEKTEEGFSLILPQESGSEIFLKR